MKKHISLILTGLLMTAAVYAQNPETLTNNSVIKMSRANLSDELITDMIENSPAMFDLSAGALETLKNDGVSEAVIQSMKDAASGKNEAGKGKPVTGNRATEVPVSLTEAATEPTAWKPSRAVDEVTVDALNYIAPLTELIRFNEKKYETMELTISEWDRQVRGFIMDIDKVKGQMLQTENELRLKKNADTKVFSDEIVSLKGKLEAYRKSYRQSKDIMIKGGGNIVKQIETMSGDLMKDMGKAYSEAGQKMTSADLDPSSGEKPVTMKYTAKEAGTGCVSYIVYLNEILAWHQNEIREINNLINEWNPRVTGLLREDAQLKDQAEPIENRIRELGANAKQNRNEISDLKKQLSGIEKSRKQLADRMKDDAKELASTVKKISQTAQAAMEERFTDIIGNITYAFGEKLSQ